MNLVEVLVSLAIMSVVVLGLATSQMTAYLKNREHLNHTLYLIDRARLAETQP
ncbi:MAG: hypothetical protein U1E78_05840 [Gammaproteobacteria bacterium]